MKVKVISSRDPDVHPGMIGEAEPYPNGYLVTLTVIRTTVLPFVEKPATICMLPEEIEFVEPQIPNEDNLI